MDTTVICVEHAAQPGRDNLGCHWLFKMVFLRSLTLSESDLAAHGRTRDDPRLAYCPEGRT